MGPGARRIALSLAFGGLLIVLDTTVTIVSLPAMVAGLDSTLPTLQWVTTGYILGLVATTPLAGWLATRHGARRVYLTSLVLFIVTSVAAGAAWNAGSLIAFRVLQGLAGGLINPVGMAIALRSADRRGQSHPVRCGRTCPKSRHRRAAAPRSCTSGRRAGRGILEPAWLTLA